MMYDRHNPLKVVTLCSGYDSQCLALDRLHKIYPEFEYDLVAWSEFDPESKSPIDKQPAVIAHNALFPQWKERNLGDMTKIDWEQVDDFDLLFYSTPCQSISQAGLQKGFVEGSGTRSSIIWNVRDAVAIKKPKYLCLENVAAMVSKKFLPMFNLWQLELEKLGYVNFLPPKFPTPWKGDRKSTREYTINSSDMGVPQNRERLFLVSIRNDGDSPKYNFPAPFPLEKRLIDLIENDVDEKYFISESMLSYFRRVSRDSLVGKSTTTT